MQNNVDQPDGISDLTKKKAADYPRCGHESCSFRTNRCAPAFNSLAAPRYSASWILFLMANGQRDTRRSCICSTPAQFRREYDPQIQRIPIA